MSTRSNGVMKVRRTAVSTCAGDVVGLALVLGDELAVFLDVGTAAQHPLQGVGAGHKRLSMLIEKLEEAALRAAGSPETSAAACMIPDAPPDGACHKSVIQLFAGKQAAWRRPNGLIHRFVRARTAGFQSERRSVVGDFADDAAAERQHADDEDHALDHQHPLAEPGQILLHGDDDEGADDGPEDGAKAAEQHHQHDLARHGPVHVGQRGVLRNERLRSRRRGRPALRTG